MTKFSSVESIAAVLYQLCPLHLMSRTLPRCWAHEMVIKCSRLDFTFILESFWILRKRLNRRAQVAKRNWPNKCSATGLVPTARGDAEVNDWARSGSHIKTDYSARWSSRSKIINEALGVQIYLGWPHRQFCCDGDKMIALTLPRTLLWHNAQHFICMIDAESKEEKWRARYDLPILVSLMSVFSACVLPVFYLSN